MNRFASYGLTFLAGWHVRHALTFPEFGDALIPLGFAIFALLGAAVWASLARDEARR